MTMILTIDNVLTPEELETVQTTLTAASFVDGKLTAGRYAKLVKTNEQIDGKTDTAKTLRSLVKPAIQRHPLIKSAIRPHTIRPLLFSRYEPGMSYGTHTDNALMGKGRDRTRSDVSLTLFLSDPNTYSGGELCLDTASGEQQIKLPAGSMVVYPSTMLHRVAEVTTGIRFAAVTWIQSLIRNPQEREILFELDTVRRATFEKYGKTVEFDLLSKTLSNLLRKWVEL
jgi:PKHD-type hydroxylase